MLILILIKSCGLFPVRVLFVGKIETTVWCSGCNVIHSHVPCTIDIEIIRSTVQSNSSTGWRYNKKCGKQ
jgi:hypothetical protein